MQLIYVIGKWPTSKDNFVAGDEFYAVVERIADICLNGSDTRVAVDETYPQLCTNFEVI